MSKVFAIVGCALATIAGVSVGGYAINNSIMVSSTRKVNIDGEKSLSLYDQRNSKENQKISKNDKNKLNEMKNTKSKKDIGLAAFIGAYCGIVISLILCPIAGIVAITEFAFEAILYTAFGCICGGGICGAA